MMPDEDHSITDAGGDEAPLGLAASAALIEAQRARVAAATDVDARLVFGVWALRGWSASRCCSPSRSIRRCSACRWGRRGRCSGGCSRRRW